MAASVISPLLKEFVLSMHEVDPIAAFSFSGAWLDKTRASLEMFQVSKEHIEERVDEFSQFLRDKYEQQPLSAVVIADRCKQDSLSIELAIAAWEFLADIASDHPGSMLCTTCEWLAHPYDANCIDNRPPLGFDQTDLCGDCASCVNGLCMIPDTISMVSLV